MISRRVQRHAGLLSSRAGALLSDTETGVREPSRGLIQSSQSSIRSESQSRSSCFWYWLRDPCSKKVWIGLPIRNRGSTPNKCPAATLASRIVPLMSVTRYASCAKSNSSRYLARSRSISWRLPINSSFCARSSSSATRSSSIIVSSSASRSSGGGSATPIFLLWRVAVSRTCREKSCRSELVGRAGSVICDSNLGIRFPKQLIRNSRAESAQGATRPADGPAIVKKDLVVIGASAGGIEALTELVSKLPPKIPASIFIVVHVPEGANSVLPKILARRGKLRATHPKDGERVEKGRIYVAPPNYHMLLGTNRIHLVRGPREHGVRPAVDPLFRSAALRFGPRVVGVVLSGNLDDGTAGLELIKAGGGTSLEQDPEEAQYRGMVDSAIRNG